MICCVDCFKDKEIKAAIEIVGRKGDCPISGGKNTWVYNSELDKENSTFEDMLGDIIEIYVPESELPSAYPSSAKKPIAEHLHKDWSIFSGDPADIIEIVKGIVDHSLFLNDKILDEPVGIPQLYDEEYLLKNSIMGVHTWEEFKKSLRNINRFHTNYINLELLREIYLFPLASAFIGLEYPMKKGEQDLKERKCGHLRMTLRLQEEQIQKVKAVYIFLIGK